MKQRRAAITGVGAYVPEHVYTNHDMEKLVDTNDEWIQTRTGVQERHFLIGEGLGTSDMAVPAVRQLLEKTGVRPEEVDLLICATVNPDYVFPATANIITDQTGMVNAFSYDIEAACSGFLYSLQTGAQYIVSGAAEKVVVVGADKMSAMVDFTDRSTCIIFGDAAAAVMLEANTEGYGIYDAILKTDGSGRKHLYQKAGGSVRPPSEETVRKREHFIYQEGQAVFKHAVYHMAEVSASIMERHQLTAEQINWLVPHQANRRIIEATANRMNLSMDKVMINIQRYGNTTNATIPLCLWEWEPQLRSGHNLILSAFGGGFTWGAMYLKWGYDPR
jgi:3-oxoacyl-[acyl-carrier-protein] synthase-3